MEFNFREVRLRHLQHIIGIGKKYVAPVTVQRHKLMFALFKRCQGIGIVALNPACLVEMYRLPSALRAVFVEQTLLYNLKLQLSDSADKLAAIKLVDKQLRHALVHQLLDARGQLLGLHRVGVLDILKHLWREAWQSLEVKLFTFGQRIANLKRTIIRQTNDIACPSLIDCSLTLRHELSRRRETHSLIMTNM